jgi:hypothetical protein
MIDYTQNLRGIKHALRKARNAQKEKNKVPYDQFYYDTAFTLRTEFGVQVSAGWVREQCIKDTDPSYLRVGALINFLKQYHGFKPKTEDDPRSAVHEPPVEETVAEEEHNARFERLKAEFEAEKAKGKEREPNAWMQQIAAQKRGLVR